MKRAVLKNHILSITRIIPILLTCSVVVESKTIFVDAVIGRGAFQTIPSISASIDGTTIPVSGATVGALNACAK